MCAVWTRSWTRYGDDVVDLQVREVAAELHVSAETVRVLIRSGELAAYRLRGTSGRWRVPRAAIDDYRDRQTRIRNDPWVRTRQRRG